MESTEEIIIPDFTDSESVQEQIIESESGDLFLQESVVEFETNEEVVQEEVIETNGIDHSPDETTVEIEIASEEVPNDGDEHRMEVEDGEEDEDLEEVDFDELEALLAASDEDENTQGEAAAGGKTGAANNRLVQLPLSRIKQIIKLDPDVDRVNNDAVFIITKATELFLEMFGKEIYKFTARAKKKTVQMRDINSCIDDVCCMQFLDGVFPPS
ncbi:hypothetical protein B566_EDAN010600 [Ephemera danica]|nr:hypothetical protein B566_EDAN010600 [Ephemera danica]